MITIQQLQARRYDQDDYWANITSPGPTTPMTPFTVLTKGTTSSESRIALNNFKKGTKKDTTVFPILRMISTMILSRDLSWQPSKHNDFLMLLTPDDGDQYEKQLFLEKQCFVCSLLVTSLETDKGRELVKEFEGDARTILLKHHHYHTESNVAQHEAVTLTPTSPT